MKAVLIAFCATVAVAGCARHENKQPPAVAAAVGDPAKGKMAINRYGCATCHVIPGIVGANGMVGPSLAHLASRPFIAQKVPNNPQTLAKWLQNPPAFDPQSTMPDLGITANDARDITAYLETLK